MLLSRIEGYMAVGREKCFVRGFLFLAFLKNDLVIKE